MANGICTTLVKKILRTAGPWKLMQNTNSTLKETKILLGVCPKFQYVLSVGFYNYYCMSCTLPLPWSTDWRTCIIFIPVYVCNEEPFYLILTLIIKTYTFLNIHMKGYNTTRQRSKQGGSLWRDAVVQALEACGTVGSAGEANFIRDGWCSDRLWRLSRIIERGKKTENENSFPVF